MKPSFALNITDTAIGLLHRTARGWLQVGETAFDTADLAEALGYLRGSALGLSPGGLTTKLVLPNSQIKYLELEAPGPDDTDRRNQIRAALVGRTPYNVEDLVFDWSGSGAKVQVAVVARETLDEAEAFAAEHRFNPVSFVGLPLKGDFNGEPWFGPTRLSVTVLEKGEKVERDSEAVHIAARNLPKSHPGAAKSSMASSDGKSGAAAKALVEKESLEKQPPVIADASPADASPLAATKSDASRDPVAAALSSPADAPGQPDLTPAPLTDPVPALPAWGTDGATVSAPPEGLSSGTSLPTEPVAVAQPAVTIAPTLSEHAFPSVEAAVSDTGGLPKDDLPPAPPAAIMAAFASRRASDLPNTKPAGPAMSMDSRDGLERAGNKSAPPPLSRPIVGADTAALRTELRGTGDAPIVRPAPGKSNSAFVTAPTIPGLRKRKSVAPDAQPGSPDTRKPLTKPGGTFASSKQRGKPRYLGLILTGLLLVFLALIAAWSSFVTSSNDVPVNGAVVATAPDVAEPAPADIPAVDDEMLADSQDPAAFDAENLAAADSLVDPAVDIDVTAEIQPGPGDPSNETPVVAAVVPETTPVAALPEPAPVGIASSESPNATPLSEAQDEIFLAAMDAPPLALDPLALPQPAASVDALPLPQLEPPPFGTVYQFDADGLIRPTPEGIITPEGVRLVAGKPPLVPPARPDAPIAAALPAATAAAIDRAVTALIPGATAPAALPFPSDPALAEARPRPRPEGLAPPAAQADDDAALTAPGATRVSSLRPLARPPTILAAGEAARQSTAAASLTAQAEQAAAVEQAILAAAFQPDTNTSPLAVRVSRKPAARPKDMSRAVEAAVAAAVRAPEPGIAEAQPEADDEPETASAAPAIPTRASLAKQATYVNAINLSKINLIGVYGTKSSRYALIRQSNGRYKKVRVGDNIDGGKVAAINSDEVRYQKSGRMVSLKLPRT